MEGTIIHRKDGAYEVRITINGKQKYIGKKRTLFDAQKLRSEAVKQKRQGKLKTSIKNIYLFEWLDKWYKNYKIQNVEKSSANEIRYTINKHAKGNFKNKPLNKITLNEAQENLMKISSSKMREQTKIFLSEAFKKAKQTGIIKENIFESVEIPKHTSEEGRALSAEEETTVFEKLKNTKIYGPFLYMRWTGCRPIGASIVEWNDIDFINKSVFVNDKKTKIKRAVPLVKELEHYLKTLPKTNSKVFPTFNHRRCSDFTRNKFDFPFIPKDLRTTFATQCANNGIPIEVLSKWLGHTTTKTTEKYYIKQLTTLSKLNAHLIDKKDTKKDTKN